MKRPVGRKQTMQRPDIIPGDRGRSAHRRAGVLRGTHGGAGDGCPLHEYPGVRRDYDRVRLVDAGVWAAFSLEVIRSDHGEALGERTSLQHDAEWFAMDERRRDHGDPEQVGNNLIRTPLLVKLSRQRGRASISSLVSALDLRAAAGAVGRRRANSVARRLSADMDGRARRARPRVAVAETRRLFEADRSAARGTDGRKRKEGNVCTGG